MFSNKQYDHGNSFNYGITVSKKVGNAVIRNKFKRIIRVLVKDLESTCLIRPGFFNIVAKKEIVTKNFDEIKKDLFVVYAKTVNK